MMRALTVTQPWAGLVASGIKLVENRRRRMIKREDFGTPFALHAGREVDEAVYQRISDISGFVAPQADEDGHCAACGLAWPDERETVEPHECPPGFRSGWYRLSRITSAVIGVATVVDLIDPESHGTCPSELPADQRIWFFGPIGYVLRDVVALPQPVPCRGYQGFWTLPQDVERDVRVQLARAA